MQNQQNFPGNQGYQTASWAEMARGYQPPPPGNPPYGWGPPPWRPPGQLGNTSVSKKGKKKGQSKSNTAKKGKKENAPSGKVEVKTLNADTLRSTPFCTGVIHRFGASGRHLNTLLTVELGLVDQKLVADKDLFCGELYSDDPEKKIFLLKQGTTQYSEYGKILQDQKDLQRAWAAAKDFRTLGVTVESFSTIEELRSLPQDLVKCLLGTRDDRRKFRERQKTQSRTSAPMEIKETEVSINPMAVFELSKKLKVSLEYGANLWRELCQCPEPTVWLQAQGVDPAGLTEMFMDRLPVRKKDKAEEEPSPPTET